MRLKHGDRMGMFSSACLKRDLFVLASKNIGEALLNSIEYSVGFAEADLTQ